MTARHAALMVLLAVGRGRTTLATEIERARRSIADERDRGLLLELANGTLRWQARLDFLLQQCSDRPLSDLDPAIRATLRLGAYQLEHLDRVPAHAVLNEAVELTRVMDQPRAAGFVNAVLRTLLRKRARLRLPPRPDDPSERAASLRYLSTTMSHPEWLVARWLDRYGFDATVGWCEFNNQAPDITIRLRDPAEHEAVLRALHDSGIEISACRFVTDALQLSPGMLGHLPRELRERVIVQEEASQIVAHAVGVRGGERILDLWRRRAARR